MKKIFLQLTIIFLLCIFSSNYVYADTYSVEARVKVDNQWVSLPKPIYFSDFYPGAWREFDLTVNPNFDLGSVLWELPNTAKGTFYIGPYTRDNFGNAETMKRRLLIMKQNGIFPMIHILNRHMIKKNSSTGEYYLDLWNDYGVRRNNQEYFSFEIYNSLLKPILNEIKLPYILSYDFSVLPYYGFTPSDIPKETFKKLFWDEVAYVHSSVDFSQGQTDMHIQFREYSPLNSYLPGILFLGVGVPWTSSGCNDNSDTPTLQSAFIKSAGNPGGLGGVNPMTGQQLNLNRYFWFLASYTYSREIRDCLGSIGLYNVTEAIWKNDMYNQEQRDNWIDGYDNYGPRFFYGYFPHFISKRTISPTDPLYQHTSWSGTPNEVKILQEKALQKGIALVGYWNEIGETSLEPTELIGSPLDEHEVTTNGAPTRLKNFVVNKINVTMPSQIADQPLGCVQNLQTSCNSSKLSWDLLPGAGSYIIRLDRFDNANPEWMSTGDKIMIAENVVNGSDIYKNYSCSANSCVTQLTLDMNYNWSVQAIKYGEFYPYSACASPGPAFTCSSATPTLTSTPTPTPTPISPSHCQPLGDVDCSGQVNSLDFTMLVSKFGNIPAGTPEDLDDSLTVNSGDLTILLLNFGNLLSTQTPTPTSICAPVGDNCKTNDNCCSLLCLNNTCAVIVPQ